MPDLLQNSYSTGCQGVDHTVLSRSASDATGQRVVVKFYSSASQVRDQNIQEEISNAKLFLHNPLFMQYLGTVATPVNLPHPERLSQKKVEPGTSLLSPGAVYSFVEGKTLKQFIDRKGPIMARERDFSYLWASCITFQIGLAQLTALSQGKLNPDLHLDNLIIHKSRKLTLPSGFQCEAVQVIDLGVLDNADEETLAKYDLLDDDVKGVFRLFQVMNNLNGLISSANIAVNSDLVDLLVDIVNQEKLSKIRQFIQSWTEEAFEEFTVQTAREYLANNYDIEHWKIRLATDLYQRLEHLTAPLAAADVVSVAGTRNT